MGAIERYKRNIARKKRVWYWSLMTVFIVALIAPYIWFDELRTWVDSLGIEIVITKEID